MQRQRRYDEPGVYNGATDPDGYFSPKVRFGQIRRKLGMETWAASNAKAKEDGDDGGEPGAALFPATPTAGRAKKPPSTPTRGTGAGVKKRTSSSAKRATNGSGRGRKTKSQALVKEEDDDGDANGMDVDSATDRGNGTAPATPIKPELDPLAAHGSNASNHFAPEFIDFPSQLAPEILERKAMLVKFNGKWVITSVEPEIHAQWLARLPAQIQSQFYVQAEAHRNGEDNEDAAAQQQIMRESLEAAGRVNAQASNSPAQMFAMPTASAQMPMATAVELGYMPPPVAKNINNGNGNNRAQQPEHVDLNSIPMHPAYLEQLEREQREQELKDQEELFGGGGGTFDLWH